MSQKAVLEIVNKALADRGFRKRLFSDPNAALAGYNLTQAEVESIRQSLEAGKGAGPAGDLDPRISRARLPLDALANLFTSARDGLEGPSPEASRPDGDVSSLPIPIPHEAQGPHATGAIPEPIPHPVEGPRATGVIPEPIPHPGDGPHATGAIPEPIPHPVEGPRATGVIPEPIPYVAHAGAAGVSSSSVPQPVPHEAQTGGAAVDSPAGQADAIPINIPYPRPEAGLHGPGGDAGHVASSPVPQPVPEPADSGTSEEGSTQGDAPPGGSEQRGPTGDGASESPWPDDEPVQA